MYIYIAQEKKSGKVYVGATTNGLEHRIADHISKSNKGLGSKFQKVLHELGKEAFEWKIIDVAESSEMLAHKERQYIIGYDSIKNGYNCDRGGGIKKAVYQYCLDTKLLLNSFTSLTEAGDVVDGDKKQISRACNSIGQKFKGFYWSFYKLSHFSSLKDLKKKSVFQYNLENTLLAEYKSIIEASRATGINKSSIAKTCRKERKTAGGCFWKYSD